MLRSSSAVQFLTALAAALSFWSVPGTAQAQADGIGVVLPAVPRVHALPGQPQIAPDNAPGGPLMNDLHERMKRIQATQDPAVRQRQHQEFMQTLKDGMAAISKHPAVGR